jgi:hypothetical protein
MFHAGVVILGRPDPEIGDEKIKIGMPVFQ